MNGLDSAQQATYDEEPEAEALTLDVCSLDIGGVDLQTSYTKYTYDTGAGVTALRKTGREQVTDRTYKTASGQIIEDFGPTVHLGVDEHGQRRRLRGRVADVHKNLVSAALVNKVNDAYLWSDGGVIVPSNSEFAKEMHKCFNRLVAKYGDSNHLKLHVENHVYGFYLKDVGVDAAAIEDYEVQTKIDDLEKSIAMLKAQKAGLNLVKDYGGAGGESGNSRLDCHCR